MFATVCTILRWRGPDQENTRRQGLDSQQTQRHGQYSPYHTSLPQNQRQATLLTFGALQGLILVRSEPGGNSNLDCPSGYPGLFKSAQTCSQCLLTSLPLRSWPFVRIIMKRSSSKGSSEMVATQEKMRGKTPQVPVDHHFMARHSSWLQIQKAIAARHCSLMP